MAKKTAPKKTKAKAKAKPSAKVVAIKPAPKAPAAVVKAAAAPRAPAQPERININIPPPDFKEWGRNLMAYANRNPAALVVGIIAVLMVWVLLVD